MNINFQAMQDKVNLTIDRLGSDIQWLKRIVSGSDAYDTGSSVTYGYGDITVFWVTGSTKAIVTHLTANEITLDIGFYVDDYEKIQLRTDSPITIRDRVIYPSGSNTIYDVLPIHNWYEGNILVSKNATIRRLMPRSGSVY